MKYKCNVKSSEFQCWRISFNELAKPKWDYIPEWADSEWTLKMLMACLSKLPLNLGKLKNDKDIFEMNNNKNIFLGSMWTFTLFFIKYFKIISEIFFHKLQIPQLNDCFILFPFLMCLSNYKNELSNLNHVSTEWASSFSNNFKDIQFSFQQILDDKYGRIEEGIFY